MRSYLLIPVLAFLAACKSDIKTDGDGDGWPLAIDCNDNDASINPVASELCNGNDDDCDGLTDNSPIDGDVIYADLDGDGFGADSVTSIACQVPDDGWSLENTDCDDLDEGVYPTAAELCDGVDQDCDSTIDEDLSATTTWYRDDDGDGYGDSLTSIEACEPPTGYVVYDGDCDDGDAERHPNALEVCNDLDDDCNGLGDDNPVDGYTWYGDIDGDGHTGNRVSVVACVPPDEDWLLTFDDCNDLSPIVYPGGNEVCDGLDNDCDGTTDDVDGQTEITVYADSDVDGYGLASDTTQVFGCNVPDGYSVAPGDCDDGNAIVHPGADELCDGIDEDCDGIVDENAIDAPAYSADLDGDGFGGGALLVYECSPPVGYALVDGDCDDLDGGIYPGAAESCDGVDEDCNGSVDDNASGQVVVYADADHDGWGDALNGSISCLVDADHTTQVGDCNDNADAIHPEALELCNGIDEDCDGVLDDGAGDGQVFYRDLDGDGHGGGVDSTSACAAPIGYSSTSDDCSDVDASVYPGAIEVCDGIDQDCDTVADNLPSDASTWFGDADGDGYGDPSVTSTSCDAASGFVADSTDCDDADAGINPGVAEICDGLDNDCDAQIDDLPSDATTWFADADGDGFGDVSVPAQACGGTGGLVSNASDCDDAAATTFPGATEICDGIDQNCNFAVDDGATDTTTYYLDTDGDSFHGTEIEACTAPIGSSSTADDCDDYSALAHPGAAELCNGFDDDCDGDVDEDPGFGFPLYVDGDDDGFGDVTQPVVGCSETSGVVAVAGDCDDTDELINPAMAEVCDGVDQDCDNVVDDGAPGTQTWYRDLDGDGAGGSAVTLTACSQPSGYFATSTDCNDLVASINPSADEVCNGADDDCNGATDDGATDTHAVYADGDADGYGAGSATQACVTAAGFVDVNGDCDDTRIAIHPNAPELCDSVDQDCDGVVDDNATNTTVYYRDLDGDGDGGNVVTTAACSLPSGHTATATDCNDLNAAIHVGAAEHCDGVDENCNSLIDDSATDRGSWYVDADTDGYGTGTAQLACSQPSGRVATNGDCNDAAVGVHPGVQETCDGVDQDCDSVVDDNATGQSTFYADRDGDGFAGDIDTIQACSRPSGYFTTATDCVDVFATIHPGATELCNGLDDDCDASIDENVTGLQDWYDDDDGDGYGAGAPIGSSCTQPAGSVANALDCDDDESLIHPAADEWCNSVDDDCDGSADEGALDAVLWFADDDGDSFGDAGVASWACEQPGGYVGDATDCNDGDEDVSPGAVEVCDASDVDENCSGAADNNDSGATGTTLFYIDADLDDFGNDFEIGRDLCDAYPGYTDNFDDCDDTDATVNPDAIDGDEVSTNLVDDNCNGLCDEEFIYANSDVFVIEEIQINPDYDAPEGDYIEIYNTTDSDIRLCSGWQLTSRRAFDFQNRLFALDDEIYNVESDDVIEAHGVGVFVQTFDPTRNGWIDREDLDVAYYDALPLEQNYDTGYDTADGWDTADESTWPDGADGIVLNYDGGEIDRVQWTSPSWYQPYSGPLPTYNGCPLQLDLSGFQYGDFDNGSSYNWCGTYHYQSCYYDYYTEQYYCYNSGYCETYETPGWLDDSCGGSGS